MPMPIPKQDGYDKIYVDTESLINFQKWFDVSEIKKEFIHPLKKCVLIMDANTDHTSYLFFEAIDNNHISFHNADDKHGAMLRWGYENGQFKMNTKVDLDKYLSLMFATNAMELFYYTTLHFMTLKPEEVEKETTRTQKVKKNKGKSKRKSVTYISNKTYKIKMKKDYSEEERREYKRLSEAWSVRGHWRTYQSGKKVWIKGHVRGEGKVNEKIYKIKTD